MKVIFDTNVLLSSLLFPGFSTKVYDFCAASYNIFSSDWLLDELSGKITGKFKLTDEQAEEYLNLLKEMMAVVRPFNELPNACRDADDNNVLQLADYIQADCITTGDKEPLILGKYEETQILSPRQFYTSDIEMP